MKIEDRRYVVDWSNEGYPRVYRVRPCHPRALTFEDARAELREEARQRAAYWRGIAASAAELTPYAVNWLDGELEAAQAQEGGSER